MKLLGPLTIVAMLLSIDALASPLKRQGNQWQSTDRTLFELISSGFKIVSFDLDYFYDDRRGPDKNRIGIYLLQKNSEVFKCYENSPALILDTNNKSPFLYCNKLIEPKYN